MEHKFPKFLGLILKLIWQGGSKCLFGSDACTQVGLVGLLARDGRFAMLAAALLVGLFLVFAGLIEPRSQVFSHFVGISTRI